MKKILSIILVFSIVISVNINSLAASGETFTASEESIYTISEGKFYCYSEEFNDDIWNVIIYIPNEGSTVTFDAKAQSEEKIYSLVLSKSEIENKSIKEILSNMESDTSLNMDMHYTSEYLTTYNSENTMLVQEIDESIVLPMASAEETFYTRLRNKYGNEYANVVKAKYTSSSFSGISKIEIKETLFYRCNEKKSYSFKAGTTLSVIALTLGATPTAAVLSAISIALSIAGETAEKNITGTRYSVIANIGRNSYVNGGTKVYTNTYKFYKHTGVDPASGNATIVDINDPVVTYSDSSSYFSSYYKQATDAYNAYVNGR